MRSLRIGVGLCLIALIFSCYSTRPLQYDVTFDYDVDFNFAKVSSYDWLTMPGTSKIDRFNRIRVQSAVAKELQPKGLKRTSHNPDVLIVMYGGDFKEVNTAVLKIDYDVYDVGRLKLAFYDGQSKKEVWWGETRADLFYNMSADKKDDTIDVAVERILEYYPPAP